MGECLVLIPGLLSDETAWAGVRDRLGQGTVCDVTTQASLGEMAADILVRHPGVLAVAGHSMGARVALEIWRQAPARVARLALLDTHPQADLRAGMSVQVVIDTGLQPAWPEPLASLRRELLNWFTFKTGASAPAAKVAAPAVTSG